MAWEDTYYHMPLDQQREILEELGFQVPDDVVERLKELVQREEIGYNYIEEIPFRCILMQLAFPQYNPDTWEMERYPEQAYWFDWEAFDVVGDYENILKGIESISGGELAFDKIEIDYSKVDWERGSGRMELTFTCNGQPCKILLRVSDDWLDPAVISQMNQILKTLPDVTGKQIYSCDDAGQGAILFYKDAFWAQEFEEKTGIMLEQ